MTTEASLLGMTLKSASMTYRIASKTTSTTSPSACGCAMTSRDTRMRGTATRAGDALKTSWSFWRSRNVQKIQFHAKFEKLTIAKIKLHIRITLVVHNLTEGWTSGIAFDTNIRRFKFAALIICSIQTGQAWDQMYSDTKQASAL